MGNFNIQQWYKGGCVMAVAIMGVGATTKNSQLLMLGIGLGLYCLGEWRNHPLRSRLHFDDFGRHWGTSSGEVRSNTLLGVVLCLIGAAIFLAALTRLAIPLFH